ncbi:MAG: phosphodiester glycosidase family protein [Bacilli bacterium]|nr:phosphodiester glycosidase family protein [Bacilli bacterium]
MVKKRLLLFSLLVTIILFTSVSVEAASLLGFEKLETIKSGEIYDGISYENFKARTTTDAGTVGNQNISFVKKSFDSPAKVVVWSKIAGSEIIGGNIIELAQDFEEKNPGYKVIAGINGDYYWNYNPINAMAQNGDLVKYDNFNEERYLSIGFNDDGTDFVVSKENILEAYYSLTVYDDTKTRVIKEVKLAGFNTTPDSGKTTIVYNNSNEIVGTNCYLINDLDYSINLGSYLLKGQVTGRVDKAYVNNGATIITEDEELISLLNTNPYLRIQKNLKGINDGISNIIGVGSQTLKAGNVQTYTEILDQNDDFEKARHPRSTIGFSEQGDLFIATIDGRQSDMAGANLREEALVMKMLGAEAAFNLDGGGSTQLLIRENEEFRILNSPSETLRKVANGVLIIVPDVSFSIQVSNIKAGSLDLNYDYVEAEDIVLKEVNLYLNNDLLETKEKSLHLNNLIRYGINYLSFEVVYERNGYQKRTFINRRINIENSVERIIEEPSNFDLQFIPDYDAGELRVVLEFDDPDSALISAILLFDNERREFEEGNVKISGIQKSKIFNFEVEYLYRTEGMHPMLKKTGTFSFDYQIKQDNNLIYIGFIMGFVMVFSAGFIVIKRRVSKR